jgi:hypothetical protein
LNNDVQYAHIKHRKMGRRHGVIKQIYDDPRNGVCACHYHHDVIDNRINNPELRKQILDYITKEIHHYEWIEENGINGIR